MGTESNDLKERTSKLSDSDLVKMITTDSDEYRQVAIAVASEELKHRGFVLEQLGSEFKITTPAGIKIVNAKQAATVNTQTQPLCTESA